MFERGDGMRRFINAARWVLTGVSLWLGIAALPELRALPFLLAAALLPPFPPLDALWKKLHLAAWLRASLALLLVLALLLPSLPDSRPLLSRSMPEAAQATEAEADFVLNLNTMKIHMPDCRSVADITSYNRQHVHGPYSQFEAWGYSPCQRCHPENAQ